MNKLIFAALSCVLLLSACDSAQTDSASEAEAVAAKATATPADAVEAAADALKDNDLRRFMHTLLPPEKMDEMIAEFERERKENPMTAEEKAEFEEMLASFTDEDAVDKMMADIEPQLVQMGAQIPMMMGMGQMMLMGAIQESEDMTAEQKEAAQSAAGAVFTKLQNADLTNADLARQAVQIMVDTAKRIDVQSADELETMSFDDMLSKSGEIWKATKDALALYGFDINAMLDSVDAEIVEQDGDNATVKISYDVFGSPQTTTSQLIKMDDRWYNADVVNQIEKNMAESAMDSDS